MKLEDQVCSLELSKRLKELGVKQESLFYWGISEFETDKPEITLYRSQGELDSDKDISKLFGVWSYSDVEIGSFKDTHSAFTVAELGEMLPKRLVGDHPLWYLTVHCNDNYYSVDFETFNGKIQKQFGCQDRNEANARAEMLIYLLEQKLISL